MFDVSGILGRLHINYVEKNDNYVFRCINPMHEDKKPSMSMNQEGLYNCFSCGEKGNLFTFVKSLTGQHLYKFLGDDDPTSAEFKSKLHADKERKEFKEPQERKLIMEGHLHDPLSNPTIMKYLESININEEFIKFFKVKYTAHSRFKFYEGVDFTNFYNRICIPVYENGRIVNMIGRDYTGEQQPKELYPKGSTTDTFFNINNINFEKPVILVEGMKGLVRVWRYFNKNVMSSFGATLGKRQREIINKTEYLLVFCDNDEAGWKMVDKIYEIRDNDFAVTAMREKGLDPADGLIRDVHQALSHPMASVDYFLKRNNLIKNNIFKW